ncbi:demethylmenaquinone methyltransferase [Pseudoalteromonas sp. HM-SA03]|uniref:RraA family protein n=1 Tax=Pseudoalteromonas sp. HM-SA03 TaxID=2029678 RepID=UPI000BAE2997|nr:RraA family protein [Pseudoalteromonas sp. HM-SA03]PAY01278.1 demethylmenaquinone methyltransferase [Pseudoalteromonas sp. HM-SA03]
MSIKAKIVDYIKSNRVSTTEVADALGKTGALEQVLPVTPEQHKVGIVRCIFASHGSNYHVHDQVRAIEKDEIALVLTHECDNKAVLGELVSKYCLLYKEAQALVVDGFLRDIAAVKRQRMSIWCTGTTPIGCVNQDKGSFPEAKQQAYLNKYEGAIAVCDDGGVVIIEQDRINEETLESLHTIEIQEDIWFFCLDTLKWDTKKIVCEKAYLEEKSLLSEVHIQQLKSLKGS